MGVGIDGVVSFIEGLKKVEGGPGEELPVRLGEGVEGLAAEVGDIEVSDFGVLAVEVLEDRDHCMK